MHVHNTTTSTRDIIAARLCGRESRRVTGLEGRLAHTRERVRSHIDTQQLASVAQLGERSTEDAEVRISIILGGMEFLFCCVVGGVVGVKLVRIGCVRACYGAAEERNGVV